MSKKTNAKPAKSKSEAPEPMANPLPKDVRKAMDDVLNNNTEGRQILKELYDRSEEVKEEKKKNKYYTGGSVHASFGKDYDDR